MKCIFKKLAINNCTIDSMIKNFEFEFIINT